MWEPHYLEECPTRLLYKSTSRKPIMRAPYGRRQPTTDPAWCQMTSQQQDTEQEEASLAVLVTACSLENQPGTNMNHQDSLAPKDPITSTKPLLLKVLPPPTTIKHPVPIP